MWHLFSSVDDGVDSELLQAKPFRYPDGGEVLRTDAAIYLRKIQMCGSIGDEMLCGFGGIASVPMCIVENVADLHDFAAVHRCSHESGLADQLPAVFQCNGKISDTVF